MATPCSGVTIPAVDETALPCDGLIVTTDCIQTTKAYNFFGIGVGDFLTAVFTKISTKVQAISNKVNLAIIPQDLTTYADDTAAGVGGLVAGKPYVDTLGYVRIKL
jgi:hypothetical protein